MSYIILPILTTYVLCLSCSSRSNVSKPELTKEEGEYFNFLSSKYKCNPDRTLNEHILRTDIDREFSLYSVILRGYPYDLNKIDEDSLKEIGYNIASNIHRNVLGKEHPYAYDHINIGFDPVIGDQFEISYNFHN